MKETEKNPLRETFGTLKFKRPIEDILKEGGTKKAGMNNQK